MGQTAQTTASHVEFIAAAANQCCFFFITTSASIFLSLSIPSYCWPLNVHSFYVVFLVNESDGVCCRCAWCWLGLGCSSTVVIGIAGMPVIITVHLNKIRLVSSLLAGHVVV